MERIGYIEKDWGTKFPKDYLWCQANNFANKNTSIFFATAHIPFKKMEFKGLISVLLVEGKEYRFATYNFAKVKDIEIDEDTIRVCVKKGRYIMQIEIEKKNGQALIAPETDGMKKVIEESVSSKLFIKLLRGNKILFEGSSDNAGIEIVK
jgi:hypothetical protein